MSARTSTKSASAATKLKAWAAVSRQEFFSNENTDNDFNLESSEVEELIRTLLAIRVEMIEATAESRAFLETVHLT